jgi:transcriptional regulator with XRE-family HTH domain
MSTKKIPTEEIFWAGFSSNLKKARKYLGLSIEEISAGLHVETTSYYKYENGTRFPKAHILFDFMILYSININFLLSGDGEILLPKGLRCEIPSDLQELVDLSERFPEVKAVLLAELEKLKVYLADKIKE